MLSPSRLALCCAAAWALAQAAAVPVRADQAAVDSVPVVAGPLTFDRAVWLAARYQLSLRAADLRASASHARIRDAGRRPNPVLLGTGENFGGDLGSERLESTLEIAQTIELGGDRGARSAVAAGESRLAVADAAVLRRGLLMLSAERFARAWSLQERLVRLREGEDLTRQAIAAASARYRAGASPLVERARAESQALAQAVARQQAQSELAIARLELALTWGAAEAAFDSLVAVVPARESEAAPRLAAHPELEQASAAEELSEARRKAAEAMRVPDVTLSGGVRHLEEVSGTGFVAGVELPIPLWNRSAGTVDAARREQEAAVADRRAVERRLEVEVANAVRRVRAAAATYDTLTLRLRPARQDLVAELLRAYRAGRISYLDLIAEQRFLLETDLAVVDAQADLWLSRIHLDLLTGTLSIQGGGR
ncbi:MAG TPA: TolC family protein [Candidatus Eisenbacteria bacterium]|nr:TolC family protein [Candidatus Eisenbacteria bacterium]